MATIIRLADPPHGLRAVTLNFDDLAVEAGQWDRVLAYVNKELFDKPAEFYNLDKLRKAAAA